MRDKVYTWGIPDELADEFEDFFEKMVVDGTVERLVSAKKKNALTTPSNKKRKSKSSSVSSKKSTRSKSSLDNQEEILSTPCVILIFNNL